MSIQLQGSSDSVFSNDIVAPNLPTQGQIVAYQQGLWIPVGNSPFSIAYNAERCIWSRIGNTIFLCAYISTVSAGTTGAGGLNLSGMPYPVNQNGNYGSIMSQKLGVDCNAAYISASAQVMQPYKSMADSWKSVTLTDVNSAGNSGQIYLQATYFTDDTTFVPLNGATLS